MIVSGTNGKTSPDTILFKSEILLLHILLLLLCCSTIARLLLVPRVQLQRISKFIDVSVED